MANTMPTPAFDHLAIASDLFRMATAMGTLMPANQCCREAKAPSPRSTLFIQAVFCAPSMLAAIAEREVMGNFEGGPKAETLAGCYHLRYGHALSLSP